MYSFELFEQSGKTAVIGWGRFNPPTIGHQKLVKKINDVAAREKGDAMLFMTKSHDSLTTPTGKPTTKEIKNPLTFDQKLPFAQKFFDINVDTDPNLKTIMSVMAHLQSQGYKRVILVAGSDRVPEYVTLLKQYNSAPDKAGNVSFSIPDLSVENAGMRDPDAEGVEGMSGTKLRQFAKEGDFANFAKGVPGDEGTAKLLYDIIRKNLGVKEDIMPASQGTISPVHESWSKKYKKSIDCSNPKGFSQKAHCAGRKARQGGKKTKSQSVSENLEGRKVDLTKNYPKYTKLIGLITKENPTKVAIEIVDVDGPGHIKVGDVIPQIAKNYIKRFLITENHHHTDIPGMLEKFLPIAMQELGITKLPGIKLTKHLKPHGTQASFGMYNPDDGKIYLAIADRHPVDILRTLAHELVHFSQDGKHELDANSGETGSKEENEANSVAGVIMRKFNNEFPDAIKSEPLLAENLLGKDTPTPHEIMQKHGMTDEEFMQQLRLGRAVEMEHTNNPKVAIEIALDHINERPDYYTMLKSVERPMGESKKKVVSANYGIGKTPGVLAKVGPKGQVPRASLHVNVPKKTAVKLGIPHTHLNEAFDAPYPMTWEHDEGESHDALVKLPDGGVLTINFYVEYADEGQEEWIVEFWRDNTLDVTGTGDQQRIFATVLSAIQQFIKIENPERIKFSAAKQTGDMTPNASRTSLYNKLVQRFANSLGYNVKTTDFSLNTVYELERLREGVAEGSEQVAISVRKGRNKFATEMTVDGEPAGSYQYDANTGRSIAEVDPKYKGKGYGKILVLHAIYTAAMSGMDFVEDESRTAEYDNVLDSLDSSGYVINDDGYWYVTGEGERFLKQSLKQGVAESTYNVSDFKINAYESMSDFRKWMRGPKTNDRGMTRHIVDIYENIVVKDNKLTESSQSFLKRKQEAKAFSAIFKQYDERERVQINLGNKIALLSSTVIPDDNSSRIELSGFTTPKKIVKINLDNAGKIDSIKFDDGSTFPEASEFTTVGGVNITNTIFFPNASSASKAHTAIWMYISNLEGKGWTVEHYMSECVAEGSKQQYLWHGSRQKIPMLEPRQSVDTGGAAGSNQNAIYATSDPKVAIAMGLTTTGSDTGMFPNDPQMVLFSGKIRKGENVYLHKVPMNGPDGKPQFVQGGNSREFHSVPGVKGIKPTEIKEVPVDKYLNLIRQATPQDLELRKKYMKQGVAEGIPQPGKSSGKPISWISPDKVITKYLTLDEILNSIQGIPYYKEVVKDRDAKDFTWGVTKKVIEYAKELIVRPDAYKNWPPIIVVDGKLQDGAHRISTINLMQKRVEPNNPIWKNAKLKVEFGKSDNVRQSVAENFADGKVKGKSRPGRVKAAGASCAGSVTDLRARAKKYSGERGKMYHWCANMKAGKSKE